MSNLVKHAERELKILGMDPEGPKDDINTAMAKGLLELVTTFAEQGHSGTSGGYTIAVLTRLLNFQNLRELTDDPSEWLHISDEQVGWNASVGEGLWQSTRRSDAFSNDGGKTYYTLEDREAGKTNAFYRSEDHTKPAGEEPLAKRVEQDSEPEYAAEERRREAYVGEFEADARASEYLRRSSNTFVDDETGDLL